MIMFDTLASRLKHARKMRKMTQADLAKKAKVKQPDISKIERGETLRPTNLLALAAALRVDPYWLDTGEGEAEPTGDLQAGDSKGSAASDLSVEQALETISNLVQRVKELERLAADPAKVTQIEHTWPFQSITREQWNILTDAQREHVEAGVRMILGATPVSGGGSGTEKRRAA